VGRQAMDYRMAVKIEALTYIMAVMVPVLCFGLYDLLLLNRRRP
jgi:hypothetical protein